jgi:hypothetical protein
MIGWVRNNPETLKKRNVENCSVAKALYVASEYIKTFWRSLRNKMI